MVKMVCIYETRKDLFIFTCLKCGLYKLIKLHNDINCPKCNTLMNNSEKINQYSKLYKKCYNTNNTNNTTTKKMC